MDHRELTKYFLDQTGKGEGDFVLYKGKRFQRGRGLFGALGSLVRFMSPFFKSAAKSVGHEALNIGANVFSDVLARKPFKSSLNERLKEGGSNLKRKADQALDSMLGSGIKTRKKRKVSQIRTKCVRRKKGVNKNKKKVNKKKKNKRQSKRKTTLDIFS